MLTQRERTHVILVLGGTLAGIGGSLLIVAADWRIAVGLFALWSAHLFLGAAKQ